MPALVRVLGSPYGYQHQRARSALVPQAIGTRCPGVYVYSSSGVVEFYRSPRCHGVMTKPSKMHLDHSLPVVMGGIVADRVVCSACNQSAGAVIGNHRRKPRARRLPSW